MKAANRERDVEGVSPVGMERSGTCSSPVPAGDSPPVFKSPRIPPALKFFGSGGVYTAVGNLRDGWEFTVLINCDSSGSFVRITRRSPEGRHQLVSEFRRRTLVAAKNKACALYELELA